MDEAGLAAALLLGLAAGTHCAGMCGGIVAALSAASAPGYRVKNAVAYHAGRALSYASAGAFVGAIGQAGLALRGTLGAQQVLFAFASLALVASGLYLTGAVPIVRRVEALGGVLWRRIEPWSRPFLPPKSPRQALMLGTLWGWLPCGMVYGALLLATASGSSALGAMTMIAFALGTLPSLIGVDLLARIAINGAARKRLRVAAGSAVTGFGLFGLVQLGLHAAQLSDYCLLPIGK